MGAMESDEKLVYDQIKDSGNLGIWTRTLGTKTGLPRNNITKALKSLEGKKQIKCVKSVKVRCTSCCSSLFPAWLTIARCADSDEEDLHARGDYALRRNDGRTLVH